MTIKTLQTMKTLTENEKMYVLTASKKDTGVAYLCWFFFGVHYFYLNKPITNIIYWLTLGGLGIWAIVDLFRIPTLIREVNEERVQNAIQEAKIIYSNEEVCEHNDEQTDWVTIFTWVAILTLMCIICDGGVGFVLTAFLWVVDRHTNWIANLINKYVK